MPWYDDIANLRIRIGLAGDDASKDALIESAADTTLDLIETYLDRKLELMADFEYAYLPNKYFLVRRWPITRDSVVITSDGNIVTTPPSLIDYERGIIYSPRYVSTGLEAKVEYIGGFDPLPPSLLWAMLAAFDAVWANTPGWGGTPGQSPTTGSGEVKKVSLVGIGSVELDVGSSTSSSAKPGSNTSTAWGIISEDALTILDRYRRESVIGAG